MYIAEIILILNGILLHLTKKIMSLRHCVIKLIKGIQILLMILFYYRLLLFSLKRSLGEAI